MKKIIALSVLCAGIAVAQLPIPTCPPKCGGKKSVHAADASKVRAKRTTRA